MTNVQASGWKQSQPEEKLKVVSSSSGARSYFITGEVERNNDRNRSVI